MLLFAIQCLCGDPAHHMGWLGGMIPVLTWLVAMGAALIVVLAATWDRRRRRVEPADAVLTPKGSGARRCPFCHGPIHPARVEASLRCSSCDAQHHVDCWREHGGCTVFGCSANGRARRQGLTRGVGGAAAALAVVMLVGCTDDQSTSVARTERVSDSTKTSDVEVRCLPATPSGFNLFESLCAACHAVADSRQTEYSGLPVRGLWGTHVAQTDGRSVLVDEQFIRESILEPQAMITSGCVPVMPTFKGQLKDAHVLAIVELYRSSADAAAVGSR